MGSPGAAGLSVQVPPAGLRCGAAACRVREIGRERPGAAGNTGGGGRQRLKHSPACIQARQMTVILICKCLPSWKSCHK